MEHIAIQKKYLFKAKLASFILQLAPFIQMIGLTGSLARQEANQKSDIDFFIVTKAGRIWTCRIFCLVLMTICGLKRSKNKIAGRVCMNIFQTDNHLKLSYRDHRESPQWLARDYAHIVPLWSKGQLFSNFMASNAWIEKYGEVFHYKNYKPNLFGKILSFVLSLVRSLAEIILLFLFVGGLGEKLLKKYQSKRIKNDLRTINSRPGEIYISDFELRFHPSKE